MTDNDLIKVDKHYVSLFNSLKEQIKNAQFRAALSVNQEVIQLYWRIGRQILQKQERARWGAKFIEALSRDLQAAFPETQGFSSRNLERMRQFAQFYPGEEFPAQLVPQLPWGHVVLLLQKVKDGAERDWYARRAVEEGWSRHSLDTFIKRNLHQQQAIEEHKVSNFLACLPSPQSSLAQEILKNPYNFDFLGLHEEAHERDIEHASLAHISKFLLELGKGFAFVGRQVPLTLDDEVYFVDLLMYHLKMHCYVVVEIKATKFKPEHAGQLNFYLNLVDANLKTEQDNPSVGLLLCKARSKIVAEYALKGIDKPMGVSEYQLTKAIPENLKGSLPTIEEIESEINQP